MKARTKDRLCRFGKLKMRMSNLLRPGSWVPVLLFSFLTLPLSPDQRSSVPKGDLIPGHGPVRSTFLILPS
jgi:hypothetical protein